MAGITVGCGSGPLFAALRGRGAIMTGFDKSAGMLELARRRLGDDADLQVADLGSPLPFPDSAFDDVVASLVLHYQDWAVPLAELRRVLKPRGRLIASVNHPIAGHALVRPGADYFAAYQWSDEITTSSGQSYVLANWHRPLPAMIDAFTAEPAAAACSAGLSATARAGLPGDPAPRVLRMACHVGCLGLGFVSDRRRGISRRLLNRLGPLLR